MIWIIYLAIGIYLGIFRPPKTKEVYRPIPYREPKKEKAPKEESIWEQLKRESKF